MRPNKLEKTNDYRPALLWLMGKIKSGTTNYVIEEFGNRFSDIIPPEHYEENNSGEIKWDWAVRWSRQDLYNSGLMGSGGRGIWTITDDGLTWLKKYPDGGGQRLLQLIYQTKKDKYGDNQKDKSTATIHKEVKKTTPPPEANRNNEDIYRLLDQQISKIKKFLQGRSAVRPSDEQLCDWIHFCYTFQLYEDGQAIFNYVDKEKVDPWHYRRTKRYIQVIRNINKY
jgi:hypothetical protein